MRVIRTRSASRVQAECVCSACEVVELEVAAAHLDAVALEVARHAVQDHGQQRQQQRCVMRALAEQLRHVEDKLQARRVGAAAQAHRQLGDESAVLLRGQGGGGDGWSIGAW